MQSCYILLLLGTVLLGAESAGAAGQADDTHEALVRIAEPASSDNYQMLTAGDIWPDMITKVETAVSETSNYPTPTSIPTPPAPATATAVPGPSDPLSQIKTLLFAILVVLTLFFIVSTWRGLVVFRHAQRRRARYGLVQDDVMAM